MTNHIAASESKPQLVGAKWNLLATTILLHLTMNLLKMTRTARVSPNLEKKHFLSLLLLTETESTAVELPINGIKVKFPFKPYPSQIGMMDKVIRSLNSTDTKQHALLESPTGSGKTMALLCGVLAWVEDMRAKNSIPRDPRLKTLNDQNNEGPEDELPKQDVHEFFAQRKPAPKVFVIEDDMDEDFTQSKGATKSCDDCGKGEKGGKEVSSSENRMTSIPKIYFCSRTHKQLAQSIRELKRSSYDARFTVLASRSHYCVNTHVRKMPDANEEW